MVKCCPLPSRVLGYQTPLEVLSPNSTLFLIPPKVFGCICLVHVDKSARSKLDPKALKCIFLGYSLNQKGYKCFHPFTRTKIVAKDITFQESVPFFSSKQSMVQGECVTSVDVDPLPVLAFLFYPLQRIVLNRERTRTSHSMYTREEFKSQSRKILMSPPWHLLGFKYCFWSSFHPSWGLGPSYCC